MSDYEAILNLIARYCQSVDDGDFEAWAETMIEDVVILEEGRVITPRSQLIALTSEFKRAGASSGIVTRHLVTNSAIDVQGESALARSDLLIVETDAFGSHIAAVGRYDDKFVRTDIGWRIARREVELRGLSQARIEAKARASERAGAAERTDGGAL